MRGLAGRQELVFHHREQRREGWHFPRQEGCQPHWVGRGLTPRRYDEIVGIAVIHPPGGLGERLLEDLAETNFHVCMTEVYFLRIVCFALLLHVTELLTAYQYVQSLLLLFFAMYLLELEDSE